MSAYHAHLERNYRVINYKLMLSIIESLMQTSCSFNVNLMFISCYGYAEMALTFEPIIVKSNLKSFILLTSFLLIFFTVRAILNRLANTMRNLMLLSIFIEPIIVQVI